MATSKKKLLDVYAGWDSDGTIQFDIHNHAQLTNDETLRLLSFSVPILANHELGETSFDQALSLCTLLVDFFISNDLFTYKLNLNCSGA